MKMSINLSNTKLGIIGGGQLGKMLNLAAHNWHLDTYLLILTHTALFNLKHSVN